MDKTIKFLLIFIAILVLMLGFRMTIFKDIKIFGEKTTIESEEIKNTINIDEQEKEKQEEIYKRIRQRDFKDKLFVIFIIAIILVCIALIIVGLWRIFTNADIPGWHAIIPILNMIQLYRIVGVNPLYIALGLIPFVGSIIATVIYIYVVYKLAKLYGKSLGYTIGLLFLPFIFFPILGFRFKKKDRKNLVY